MPLTEQETTELQQALTAGNYGENSTIKTLAGLGLRIRTEADETNFLTSRENQLIAGKTSEWATNIEKDVLEATGIEKKAGEKYHDYLKRAAGEIKTELTTLKEKGGNTNEADKARITELEGLLQTKETDYTKTLSELKGTIAKEKATTVLGNAEAAIRATLKTDIAHLDDVVAARLAKFNAEYKADVKDDGSVEFIKNSDGKVALSTKDGKPLKAGEIMAEFFKDLVATPDGKKGGAGSGTGGSGNGGSGNTKTPGAEVTTKLLLAEWMKAESGLKPGSKEYNDRYKELGEKLPMR